MYSFLKQLNSNFMIDHINFKWVLILLNFNASVPMARAVEVHIIYDVFIINARSVNTL